MAGVSSLGVGLSWPSGGAGPGNMACAAGGGDCGPRYLLAAGSSVPVESGGLSAGSGVACSAVAARRRSKRSSTSAIAVVRRPDVRAWVGEKSRVLHVVSHHVRELHSHKLLPGLPPLEGRIAAALKHCSEGGEIIVEHEIIRVSFA